MLDANQLASMRSTWNSSLPDSGTILRRTEVSDGAGGYTVTWPAAGTAACRVGAGQSGVEMVVDGRLTPVTVWPVHFAAVTDIRASDRVATGGNTYEVAPANAPHSWEVARTVYCTRVD